MPPKPPEPPKLADLEPREFLKMIIFSSLVTSRIEGLDTSKLDSGTILKFREEAERVVSTFFDG
jgi:hypothetical protein